MWREPAVKRIGRRLVWVCPVCENTGRAWRRRRAVMAAHWHMRAHSPKGVIRVAADR